MPAEVLAFRMRGVLNVDVRRPSPRAACQFSTCAASRTVGEKRRRLDETLKIQSNIRVVEIDGPHLLLRREPAKCFEAIDRFLEAVS